MMGNVHDEEYARCGDKMQITVTSKTQHSSKYTTAALEIHSFSFSCQ